MFTFLKSMLVILGLLCFHINFIMSINSSQKYTDILIEITLNLLILWVEKNPRDGGAWWTAMYGVAQSQTEAT